MSHKYFYSFYHYYYISWYIHLNKTTDDDVYSWRSKNAHYALSLPIQIYLNRAKFHEASGIENDARKYALPDEHSHAATFTLECVMDG